MKVMWSPMKVMFQNQPRGTWSKYNNPWRPCTRSIYPNLPSPNSVPPDTMRSEIRYMLHSIKLYIGSMSSYFKKNPDHKVFTKTYTCFFVFLSGALPRNSQQFDPCFTIWGVPQSIVPASFLVPTWVPSRFRTPRCLRWVSMLGWKHGNLNLYNLYSRQITIPSLKLT